MSTVSVTNLKNASSSVNNAVTTSGGDLTNAAGVSFMGGSKNLLYNGAMQVAQRGTSTASITTGGYYTADRWNLQKTNAGTWTQSVEADGPTGSGLTRSLKMLCTTGAVSPAAADLLLVEQAFEGQDCQRIAKGTASAQQLALSFWVKSNVTGTYIVRVSDNDNSRQVCAAYTVSASATWEKKTITFPADTTGTLDNDNSASLRVQFWLVAGSDRTSGTLATAWASAVAANAAVGQTNLAAATNNYWQVTGVQLEIGPVATSFEFKSYGQELRECQRYYYRITPGADGNGFGSGFAYSTTQADCYVAYPVTMRQSPSAIEQSGTASHYRVFAANGSNVALSSVPTNAGASPFGARVGAVVAAGLTGGQGTTLCATNATAYLAWSAEL